MGTRGVSRQGSGTGKCHHNPRNTTAERRDGESVMDRRVCSGWRRDLESAAAGALLLWEGKRRFTLPCLSGTSPPRVKGHVEQVQRSSGSRSAFQLSVDVNCCCVKEPRSLAALLSFVSVFGAHVGVFRAACVLVFTGPRCQTHFQSTDSASCADRAR